MKIWTMAVFLAAGVGAATAQENVGAFSGELRGRLIETAEGVRFELEEPFGYTDPNGMFWGVPPLERTDGASIPPAFWVITGHPFGGPYLWPAVVHDYYCDIKTKTDTVTHLTFYYGMRAKQVEDWKAKLMYWAVSTFGPRWTLVQQTQMHPSCELVDGKVVCTAPAPVTRTVAVSEPSIDFTNPETLAAAIGKFNAVAKTLKTTDGATFDITALGKVEASLDNLAQSAGDYRELFVDRRFLNDASLLGLMTAPEFVGFDEISSWPDNRLPLVDFTPEISVVGPDEDILVLGPGDAIVLAPGQIELFADGFSDQLLQSQTVLVGP